MRLRLLFTGLFYLSLFLFSGALSGQNSYSYNNVEEISEFDTRISKYLISSGAGKTEIVTDREKIPVNITWKIADTFKVDVRRSMLLAKGYNQTMERGIMSFYELSPAAYSF